MVFEARKNGEIFMGDIQKDHRIYFEDPKPSVPVCVKPGNKPTKLRAQSRVIRVDTWIAKQSVDRTPQSRTTLFCHYLPVSNSADLRK